MNTPRLISAAVLALSLGFAMPVIAGEGHDHGDGPATPNAKATDKSTSGGVKKVAVKDDKGKKKKK